MRTAIRRAQPDGRDLHVDGLLSSILLAYMNMDGAFVAGNIFPDIPVNKRSDLIGEIRKEDFFRDQAVIRSPGDKVPATGFGTKKDKTYFCLNFAAAVLVDPETRNNQDNPFDVDRIATKLVSERILIRKEKLFAQKFFKKDVWETQEDFSGDDFSQWSQFATANPVNDIERNSLAIESVTARVPSDLTIGREVWSQLKQNPLLMEKIKFTQRAVLTRELVAALLELDSINIGRAIEVTSAENAADTNLPVLVRQACPSNPHSAGAWNLDSDAWCNVCVESASAPWHVLRPSSLPPGRAHGQDRGSYLPGSSGSW